MYEILTKLMLNLSAHFFLFDTSGQVDKALNSYLFVFSSTSIALVFADDRADDRADDTAEDGTFSQWDQESVVATWHDEST